MHGYQQAFLQLALQQQALRFGDFTLKSGRSSPYFFNAGSFDRGAALAGLARCYADALQHSDIRFDMLFGPAYKGIPLATALAIELAARGRDTPVAFNRKEAKAHGEGGALIGAPLQGRVLVVDDVITAGTAVLESIQLIRDAGAIPCGLLVALDRQERGTGAQSAAQQISAEHQMPVTAIAGLADLLAYTESHPELAQHAARLLEYRQRHAAAA